MLPPIVVFDVPTQPYFELAILMTNDQLTRAMQELLRAQFDPTAPLPFFWPDGVAGVLLLFVMPVAAGIPFGVVMARDVGLSPPMTAGLYLVSDLLLPVTAEPFLALLRWLGKRYRLVGSLGRTFSRATESIGLSEGRVHGPLGLILFSFSISPTTGRAAAAAAGHGFFSGWTLAIIGDMLFFGMLMATTLWITSVFGDSRQTVGAIAIGAWVLPLVIRRLRRGQQRVTQPRVVPLRAVPAAAALNSGSDVARSASEMPAPLPRRRVSRVGRRRPSRGLHR